VKLKTRKLKSLGQEAMAIIDFLVHEAIARNKSMGYKLKIPYSSVVTSDQHNDGDIVIEVKVRYDGEFKEEPDEQSETFKVTGPDKGRH